MPPGFAGPKNLSGVQKTLQRPTRAKPARETILTRLRASWYLFAPGRQIQNSQIRVDSFDPRGNTRKEQISEKTRTAAEIIAVLESDQANAPGVLLLPT